MNDSRGKVALFGCWPLAAVALFAACSKSGSSGSATMPVSPLTISLASGRNLFLDNSADVRPDFQLTDPEVVQQPLVFANHRNDANNIRNPMILRKESNIWKFVELPSLHHTEWVYAGAAYQRGELWAILDSVSETRIAGLYLLRSKDGGETWSLFSALKPPTVLAEFVSFTLTPEGSGRIVVHQDDDTDAIPRGLYLYQTNDGGKSWNGPTFTSDDMVSADLPISATLEETIRTIDPSYTPPFTPTSPRFPNYRQPNGPFQGRGRRG